MVLLHHELPDGSSHFDWLIERPGPTGPSPSTNGPGTLLSFRVQRRIDRPDCGQFDAQPIPDHRRLYLDYEGPVSGNRGTVRRVAAGEWSEFVQAGGEVRLIGWLGGLAGVLVGREAGSVYRFEVDQRGYIHV